MEANEFIQKVLPLIHGYIGKYSNHNVGIGIYPDFHNGMMSKIHKQYSIDEDEVFIYTFDLNLFANGSAENDIKEGVKSFIWGATFGLSSLFANDNQHFFGLSNKGIYYVPNAEKLKRFFCPWDAIVKIESSGVTIHITIEDGTTYRIVDVNNSITGVHPSLKVEGVRMLLAAIWGKTQETYDSMNDLWDNYLSVQKRQQNEDDNAFEVRLKEYAKNLEKKDFTRYSPSVQRLVLKILANAYSMILDDNDCCKKIIDIVKTYESRFDDDAEMRMMWAMAQIMLQYGKNYHQYIKYVFRDLSDTQIRILSENEISCYRSVVCHWMKERFMDIDYNDRRFLVIDSSMSYLESDSFVVLPKDNLPEGICFPLGHPQEQELYVCHPYNHNLYIPYELHEFELFKDKMDELRFVLQAMGAKSIRISDINGVEGTNNRKQHINVTGDINAKVNKFHADGDFKKSEEEYEKLRRAYETESVFYPQQMPFVPDNLVWYPHQPEWKRLFEQRNKGLVKHRICISVDKEAGISTQQQLALKTDFQALFLKTNANVKIDTDSMFEEKRSSEWVLEVEFELLDVLRARENREGQIAAVNPAITALSALTDEEQRYMEEVKFCFEDDNQIDDKERWLLERMRVKLDISEERAAELENMVLPAENILSAEESEYCETVAEYAADGHLSERDLRLLSRLASSLDISPEREKELLAKTIYKYE